MPSTPSLADCLPPTPSTIIANYLTRTSEEIDAELFRLHRLKLGHCSRTRSFAAICAQIHVLRRRLTCEEASDHFEDEHIEVISEALNAADWLRDDGESMSAG